MRTREANAEPVGTSLPPLFASANAAILTYAYAFGTAFGMLNELSVELVVLGRRAADLWLGHFSPAQTVQIDDPRAPQEEDVTGPEAEEETCCGEACTSKTCQRALKSLELAMSDFH